MIEGRRGTGRTREGARERKKGGKFLSIFTGSCFTDPEKGQDAFQRLSLRRTSEHSGAHRLNRKNQTLVVVLEKQRQFSPLTAMRMSVWEAMERLNRLVDDSDPDTEFPQMDHSLQTAGQIRHDGQPRWMILTGLITDLGKVLCLLGEPQWAVVRLVPGRMRIQRTYRLSRVLQFEPRFATSGLRFETGYL